MLKHYITIVTRSGESPLLATQTELSEREYKIINAALEEYHFTLHKALKINRLDEELEQLYIDTDNLMKKLK